LVSACEKPKDFSANGCCAIQCLVAHSLLALVTAGQDPTSRRVLGIRCPNSDSAALPSQESEWSFSKQPVHVMPAPRGHFVKANEISAGECLFDSAKVVERLTLNNLTPGDLVTIKHIGLDLKWYCYQWEGLVKGPMNPATEAKLRNRWNATNCFSAQSLARKNDHDYLAKVWAVNKTALTTTIDVIYQTPVAVRKSGSMHSLGSLEQAGGRLPLTQESDVDLQRVSVASNNSWWKQFVFVWKGWHWVYASRGYPTSEPGTEREQEDSQHRSATAATSGGRQKRRKVTSRPMAVPDSESGTAVCALPARFRRLADALRDTPEAHIFRCRELLANKDELQAASEEVRATFVASFPGETLAQQHSALSAEAAEGVLLWPRQAHMEAGKSLFVHLLRLPAFWKVWQARGGESCAFGMKRRRAKLFFVRLGHCV